MSNNDLQALFANLKPKSRDPSMPSHNADSARHVSQASTFAGPAHAPISPPAYSNQMAQPAPSATAQSLLSLLNFGPSNTQASASNNNSQPLSSAPEVPPPPQEQNGTVRRPKDGAHGATTSASDLLSRFMAPSVDSRPAIKSPPNVLGQGGGQFDQTGSQAPNESQDALLKLLSRAQSAHANGARHSSSERAKATERTASPQAQTSKLESSFLPPVKSTLDPAQQQAKSTASRGPSIFTYTNPFEAIHASLDASRSQTPKNGNGHDAQSKSEDVQPSIESVGEKPGSPYPTTATPNQFAKRRILTPRLPSSSKQNGASREASLAPATPPAQVPATPVEEIVASVPPEVKQRAEAEAGIPGALGKGSSSETTVEKPPEQPEGGDEWEDVDGSPNKDNARVVPVYNFPIRPFVSLVLELPEPTEIGIRDDGVMEISRLKKEFDQLDRSLAAANPKYITYALVKNGGMRIIRQDDGSDRQVFKNSRDRIFNITLCTTASTGEPSDDQAVLGTGVSGAVYYATINQDGNDLFEKNELETESLIFPPYPAVDENTSGGVLKTRAKRSSRHPEFFAIGRGKAIHLIWPATALSARYGVSEDERRVDVEKFFEERSLQIITGKAGKDFTFSEDDTLIVSLDKTGRLRFWDIRMLIDKSNANSARVTGVTVDQPLLSLSTASPTEKSWPTSVTFVDKARPYTKGGAIRYVLVGLRQNHTLQLWDIALAKAVQELNFPHDNETDGICSVCYHPNSGIIVVGHPTRNSLFFIHLSAPRYTLASSLTQAAFVQRVASKDSDLPKPDSTACMSGIREMSFAQKGQLRSVELMPLCRTPEAQKALDDKTPLFELYVVHSKGVTCLKITKEDLGWDASSKVIHGIDAAKEGFVSLKELHLGSVVEEGLRDRSPPEELPQPSKASKKKSSKKVSTSAEPPEVKASTPPPAIVETNGPTDKSLDAVAEPPPTKESKKSKKKAAKAAEVLEAEKAVPAASQEAGTTDQASAPFVGALPAAKVEPTPSAMQSAVETSVKSDAVKVGISGDWLDKELKKVEKAVSGEFRKEMSVLYQSIQNDRVIQDSAAIARQEALLRLVSTTLTNNVEKTMSRILSAQMQQSIIPALTTATVQAVSGQVGEAVAKSLHTVVPRELSAQLPALINSSLQSPNMTRTISEAVSAKVSKQTETQLAEVLQKQVVPAFKTLALSAAEKAASEVEVRLAGQIQQLETNRRNDMIRLEKLGEVLQTTAETLQRMSDSQVAFQTQILEDRRQISLLSEGSRNDASRQTSTAVLSPSPNAMARPTTHPRKTEAELELEDISTLMEEGRYEEASIKWLQSKQQSELFDKLFIHFTPDYLSTDVSPLIAFSIAVTIGNTLDTNTARRLEWISAAFNSVDLSDPEIADLAQHAPALLSSLIQKLERLYMTIAERDATDPALQVMPVVSRRAKEMRASLEGTARGRTKF